jgi:hypothetical protein
MRRRQLLQYVLSRAEAELVIGEELLPSVMPDSAEAIEKTGEEDEDENEAEDVDEDEEAEAVEDEADGVNVVISSEYTAGCL